MVAESYSNKEIAEALGSICHRASAIHKLQLSSSASSAGWYIMLFATGLLRLTQSRQRRRKILGWCPLLVASSVSVPGHVDRACLKAALRPNSDFVDEGTPASKYRPAA
jgi:hypothetical protein